MLTESELRNQELARHEESVDRNVEQHLALNLNEKQRSIASANQNSATIRIANIITFLFGALELVLAIRLVFRLIGANESNRVADFIYKLSEPFVSAFASLVENPTLGTSGVLEITTLLAMLVWAIVGWMAGRLVWLTLSRPR